MCAQNLSALAVVGPATRINISSIAYSVLKSSTFSTFFHFVRGDIKNSPRNKAILGFNF